MSVEAQQKIFTKFYRIEDFRTRKTGGTGLGLYISKVLADSLGGKITVVSKVNEGSTFRVVLPTTVEKQKRRKSSQKSLDNFIETI
jgi:signal transduction histidine kinase